MKTKIQIIVAIVFLVTSSFSNIAFAEDSTLSELKTKLLDNQRYLKSATAQYDVWSRYAHTRNINVLSNRIGKVALLCAGFTALFPLSAVSEIIIATEGYTIEASAAVLWAIYPLSALEIAFYGGGEAFFSYAIGKTWAEVIKYRLLRDNKEISDLEIYFAINKDDTFSLAAYRRGNIVHFSNYETFEELISEYSDKLGLKSFSVLDEISEKIYQNIEKIKDEQIKTEEQRSIWSVPFSVDNDARFGNLMIYLLGLQQHILKEKIGILEREINIQGAEKN